VLLSDNTAYAHDLAEPLAALNRALAPSYERAFGPPAPRA